MNKFIRFIEKLFGIIKVCSHCREEYRVENAGYIEARRSNARLYRKGDGSLGISTYRPRYEVCKDCARKHREAEDFRLFGITPEDKERARKRKEDSDREIREAIQRLHEWENKNKR